MPIGLTVNALAMALRGPATRIGDILNERQGITADSALRLPRYFWPMPEFWLNLQQSYGLPRVAIEEGTKSTRVSVHHRHEAAGPSRADGSGSGLPPCHFTETCRRVRGPYL